MSLTSFSPNDGQDSGGPPPPPPPDGPPAYKAFKSSLATRLETNPEAMRIIADYEAWCSLRDKGWSKKMDEHTRTLITLHTQVSQQLSSINSTLQDKQGDRIGRLKAALEPLAKLPVPVKTTGIFYRADGRSPWTMQMYNGFAHWDRSSIELVRSGLKATVLQFGSLSDWIAEYRIKKNNNGLPTISTAPNPGDANGASNSRWQYGIQLPGTMHKCVNIEAALGVDFPKKHDRGDELWMDADTIDQATEIAIIGGDLPECTFLTEIKLEYLVSYVLLTDGPNYLTGIWRPFVAKDLALYRDVLKKYGEFNFPE